MKKKLYRSATDKKFAGVCGGIAAYLDVDSTLIRLAFILCVLFLGSGLLVYIICALVIPEEPTAQGGYQSGQGSGFNPGSF